MFLVMTHPYCREMTPSQFLNNCVTRGVELVTNVDGMIATSAVAILTLFLIVRIIFVRTFKATDLTTGCYCRA